MKTMLMFCLGAIFVASFTADRPACISGEFVDCFLLYYTYQAGVFYCCADAELRPILSGRVGSASVSCSCYTMDEYCAAKPTTATDRTANNKNEILH